jgi:hypothetical protein
MRNWATLGVPPAADPHDRIQTGRFLRALLGRWLVVSLALWTVVALVTELQDWVLIVGGVSLAALATDVLWLSYRVRRDERRASTR